MPDVGTDGGSGACSASAVGRAWKKLKLRHDGSTVSACFAADDRELVDIRAPATAVVEERRTAQRHVQNTKGGAIACAKLCWPTTGTRRDHPCRQHVHGHDTVRLGTRRISTRKLMGYQTAPWCVGYRNQCQASVETTRQPGLDTLRAARHHQQPWQRRRRQRAQRTWMRCRSWPG